MSMGTSRVELMRRYAYHRRSSSDMATKTFYTVRFELMISHHTEISKEWSRIRMASELRRCAVKRSIRQARDVRQPPWQSACALPKGPH
jgi:hypothetical protein